MYILQNYFTYLYIYLDINTIKAYANYETVKILLV